MGQERTVRDLIVRSIALAAFVSISYWLLLPGGFASRLLGIDLFFLFFPVAISSAIFYLSSIVKLIYASKLAEVASGVLRKLAILLAIYLILAQWISGIWSSVFLWIFIIVFVMLFYHFMSLLAKLYGEPLLEILSKAISLFFSGISVSNALTPLLSNTPPPLKAFPEVAFWTFTVSAAASLISIFIYFPNPYLQFIGTKIGSKIAWIMALIFLALTYFFIYRPQIAEAVPISISLIEWGIICLSFLILYMVLKGQVDMYLAEQLRLGNWTKLVQEIDHRVDPEQVSLADLIREFIDHGVKDGIITRLISIMLLNGLSEGSIRSVVRRILEHQDIPYPRLRLAQWIRGIEEENKKRRMNLLKTLLEEIEREVKTKSPRFFEIKQVGVKMEGGM
jgi:hypothetical protein